MTTSKAVYSLSDESPDAPDLTQAQASELLRLGLSGPSRPIDRVIERIDRDGGSMWFDRAVAMALAPAGVAAEQLLRGDVTRAQLISLKDASKSALEQRPLGDKALIATLGYFLGVAGALAFYAERITSRPRTDVDPVLVDLAEVAPPPWRELLQRAAMAPHE